MLQRSATSPAFDALPTGKVWEEGKCRKVNDITMNYESQGAGEPLMEDLARWKDLGGLNAPLLMHLAEEDEFISKPAQAAIKAALATKPRATVHSYPGQKHAFSRHR